MSCVRTLRSLNLSSLFPKYIETFQELWPQSSIKHVNLGTEAYVFVRIGME